MTQPRADRKWLAAFLAALLAVVGAVLFLGYALFNTLGDDDASVAANDGATTPLRPGAERPADEPAVWIDPGIGDSAALPAGYEAAASREQADIVLAPTTAPGGIAWQYDVPVASLYTGVYALTSEQLQGIFSGAITDWSEVGGVAGPITVALASGDEQELSQTFGITIPAGAQRYPDTNALVAAIAPDAGVIAFVPLDRVDISMAAIAVDGVDLVRGTGDASAWPFTRRMTVTSNGSNDAAALATVTESYRAAIPEATTMVVTGDILQTRCTLSQIEATGDWAAALRGPMAEYLAAADLTVGYMDTSVQDVSEPLRCVETTNLTAPAESLAALTLAGFDVLTVATNHVFDCGAEFCGTQAFTRTLELLREAGITPVGGGLNLEEAYEPVIKEVNGISIGFIAFDDVAADVLAATDTEVGTAPLDDDYSDEIASGYPPFYGTADQLSLDRFTANVRDLAGQVDVAVVLLNSGTEETHDPSERSIKAARAAAEAGADFVVGNQAHWVQAVEIHDGVFIAYAPGNFIFDQVHSPEFTQGYLIETTLHGDQPVNVRLVPYQIESQYRPTFVEGDLAASILTDVFTASTALPVDTPGSGQ